VALDLVHLDRPEGPWAHVEDELGPTNSALGESPTECCGEVQARGRGRDAAGLSRIDRLIPVPVLEPILAPDIGRKGNVPVSLDRRARVVSALEAHPTPNGGRSLEDDDAQVVRNANARTLLEPLSGAQKCLPGAVGVLPDEECLRFAATLPPAEKPRREDPAPVGHQEIARVEELGEVPKHPVLDPSGVPAQDEQPRRIPLGERLLGDAVRRKLVVEEGNVHES
jgi:hypothetical protein